MAEPGTSAVTVPTADMPGFRMLFPPGWAEYGVDEGAERDLLVRARAKIKPLARPDLDFSVTSSIKGAFRQLRAREAFALYIPSEVSEDSIQPISMTASRLLDPHGQTLDGQITALFRDQGGEFLGGDRNIVRWRRTHRQLEGVPDLINEQINYAIPVAGTGRRMALLLSTSILRDAGGTVSDDEVDLLVTLSDSIVGTFTWASSLTRRNA